MDENLRDPEIINLLHLPYDSEDELGELLDEDEINEEIGLDDETLFAKLDEALSFPHETSPDIGVPDDSSNNLDSIEIDEPDMQRNPILENACGESVTPNDLTDEINPIEPNEKTSNKTNKRKRPLSQKHYKQKANEKINKNKRIVRQPQIWTHGNLENNEEETKFKGNYDLPEEVSRLEHPYQYFKYFFDDELLSKIAAESLLYSTQKNPARPKPISNKEIEKFLGIIIFSSISNCTSLRDMWHPIRGHSIVSDCMGINNFDSIRSALHFNDNAQQEAPNDPNRDRLYKLRPVIDKINTKSLTIPMRSTLSIDEQTCATKTKHHLRLYNPNKPHKWGYKLYVLCDDKGFAHKFEIYSGNTEASLVNEPDLNTTGNLVIRLAREVPRNINHTIYCDNYYSSLPLFSHFHKQGIFMLGTFRKDRLPDCPFEDKSAMAKRERGYSDEWITVVDNTPISVVSWHDNQIVTIGSTLCGTLPLDKIRRYDKKSKTFNEIPCPKIVKIYNKHMGGVDLMDSHIGRHHIKIKSKKWYFRLFYHMVDMVVVNSWILFSSKKENKKNMSQKDFRTELAVTLCSIGMKETPKRGRPAGLQNIEQEELRKKATAAPRPPVPVIKDKTDHWPIWEEKRNRCKMPNCKGNTNVKCSKCNLNLCFHAKKNCFMMYHN